MFCLNNSANAYLRDEPFFLSFSRMVTKRPSRSVKTAGVTIQEGTGWPILLYNPEYFDKLTEEERKAVFKHELYHLIFEHLTLPRMEEVKFTKIWNISLDLAINGLDSFYQNALDTKGDYTDKLRNTLPKSACIPEEKGTPFEGYPRELSSEQYLSLLKKDAQENPEKFQKIEGDGSHDKWGEEELSVAKERINDMLKKATKETAKQKMGWGSLPEEMVKDLKNKAFNDKVDWRKVLRFFIKRSQKGMKRKSIKKINKRFPYIHPAKVVNRVARICVSIDQSGSVSDDMLSLFFSELSSFSKIASFSVVPFDTSINERDVFVWKKGSAPSLKRVYHGGTCFNAPTTYCNEKGFDGHIILTDMGASKPIPSKCQRIWITDKQSLGWSFETKERILTID